LKSANFSNDKDELRIQIFEVLDRVNSGMTPRFCDNSLSLWHVKLHVDPSSEIFTKYELQLYEYMKPVADWYVDFSIDSNKLRAQTALFKEIRET
jgi:hypothetical protein